ncbi:hypothetical protein Tco_0735798, partial [Tanacetum coccineum]
CRPRDVGLVKVVVRVTVSGGGDGGIGGGDGGIGGGVVGCHSCWKLLRTT